MPTNSPMNPSEVPVPAVASGRGFGVPYALYLHCMCWAARTYVYYRSPPCELFDSTVTIDTPYLGAGQVPLSICVPRNASNAATPRPLILVMQGGGFTVGQPKDGGAHDRWLSDKLSAIVISTEYAKAPRHPFPHALLQLHEVLKWALSPSSASTIGVTVDPSRVATLGMSAGGNLATSLILLESFSSGPCARFRNELPPQLRFTGQALLYPCIAPYRPYRERWEASGEASQAKSLPVWLLGAMEDAYLPPYVDQGSLFASPVEASVALLEQLSLPDTLVITAGLDSLKAEASEYAANLRAAKVRVLEHDYPEAVHGFTHRLEGMDGYREEDIKNSWELIADFFQQGFLEKD